MASPMAAGDPNLNPLGVDPNAPLDIVIFKGGYGDDYAIYVRDQMYKRLYPGAEITYAGTQRLQEQYQARFVEGNPPDIMDNSGAGNFNTTNLVNEGQLADLTDLMEAPAWGQESVRFADTLIPGSQADGVFNGVQYVLKYAYGAYGLWYSQKFMQDNGYSYPETWDDMLALCEEIKAGGVAPWTFQGQYPYYIRTVFDQLVYKGGGIEAIAAIDNLEEGAWQSEVVGTALNSMYQLVERGYILEGTEALSHTESQALWLEGRAAFIPCGSWLENEMAGLIPADFGMSVQAVPSLTANDVLPRTAIQASAGEDFIVPEQGRNVQGGKEYLRLLFSKEGARVFSESTKSLTSVIGAAEGLDLGTAFASLQQAVTAAGENTFKAQYYDWYKDLDDETQNLFGQMMAGQLTPQDVMDGAEDVATMVREDDSIPKYRREV
jgi:N-acetylglucosamine transport system substrate-binding protein